MRAPEWSTDMRSVINPSKEAEVWIHHANCAIIVVRDCTRIASSKNLCSGGASPQSSRMYILSVYCCSHLLLFPLQSVLAPVLVFQKAAVPLVIELPWCLRLGQ